MPKMSATDLHARDIDDARFGVRVARGQFVRLQNGDHVRDAGDRFERFGRQLLLVTDDADNRAKRAAAEMGFEPQRFDPIHHMLDLSIGSTAFEDQNHGKRKRNGVSGIYKRSPAM